MSYNIRIKDMHNLHVQYLNIHMYYVSTCYIIQAEVAAAGLSVCCHYQILDLQLRPSILHRHMQVSLGGCYHCLAQQGQQSLHEEPWVFSSTFFRGQEETRPQVPNQPRLSRLSLKGIFVRLPIPFPLNMFYQDFEHRRLGRQLGEFSPQLICLMGKHQWSWMMRWMPAILSHKGLVVGDWILLGLLNLMSFFRSNQWNLSEGFS